MDNEIIKYINAALDDAKQRREDAGMGGYHTDGGASQIEENVRFYKLGLNKSIPIEWKQLVEKKSPEYKLYLDLKRKFENL